MGLLMDRRIFVKLLFTKQSYNVHLWPTYTKYDYKHIFGFHSLKKQRKYNLLHVLSLNHPKHWYHVTVRPILLIAPITGS